MSKNCFITGANGYLGSTLAKHLAKTGYQVTSLSRNAPTPNTLPFSLNQKFDQNLLKGCDVLIHCAYDFKSIQWQDIYKTNVQGSIDLLQKAANAGVKKIIFISSISAFEGCKSLYGKAKLEVEQFVKSIGGISMGPALIYGEDSGGMIGSLRKSIKSAKAIPVVGGSQKMYLSNEEDLAKFIVKIIEEDIHLVDPITVANPHPQRFVDILKKIALRESKNPIFVPLPWWAVWTGIKMAERIGMKLNFRSDSLISLVNPNKNPDFSTIQRLGVQFREF